MSDTLIQAGHFKLTSIILRNYDRSKSIDISNPTVTSDFNINESMSSPFIYGDITIFDGSDLISKFPIIGEEYIEFNYTDFFGNTRIDEFIVYSVSNIKYPQTSNPTLMQYTLNFISIPRILTDGYRIMRGYRNNNISEYVKSVYNEFYKAYTNNKRLKIKDLKVLGTTDGPINLTVPNFTPTETLLFFARHAFNSSSKTQTFRFFENRDSYYFATNENIIDHYGGTLSNNYLQLSDSLMLPDAKIFTYNYKPDIGPANANNQMWYIRDIDFGEKVNSLNDIKYGAYNKRIGQIDLLNGTAQMIPTFNFRQDFTEKNLKLAHTDNFINDTMPNKYVRYIIKDYAVGGEPTGPDIKYDMHYSDLYDRKSTYLYHYKQNSIDILIYGRNSIVAGSVVNIQLPIRKVVTDGNIEYDIERSGYYLADSVRNIFDVSTKEYSQQITLSRYGIGMK